MFQAFSTCLPASTAVMRTCSPKANGSCMIVVQVDAGAQVIITQLFYDVEKFIKFTKDCRALGIECPIIPGKCCVLSHIKCYVMLGLELFLEALHPVPHLDMLKMCFLLNRALPCLCRGTPITIELSNANIMSSLHRIV